jgi:hypothetical protein
MDQLGVGVVWDAVLLFSLTFHEAAHASHGHAIHI